MPSSLVGDRLHLIQQRRGRVDAGRSAPSPPPAARRRRCVLLRPMPARPSEFLAPTSALKEMARRWDGRCARSLRFSRTAGARLYRCAINTLPRAYGFSPAWARTIAAHYRHPPAFALLLLRRRALQRRRGQRPHPTASQTLLTRGRFPADALARWPTRPVRDVAAACGRSHSRWWSGARSGGSVGLDGRARFAIRYARAQGREPGLASSAVSERVRPPMRGGSFEAMRCCLPRGGASTGARGPGDRPGAAEVAGADLAARVVQQRSPRSRREDFTMAFAEARAWPSPRPPSPRWRRALAVTMREPRRMTPAGGSRGRGRPSSPVASQLRDGARRGRARGAVVVDAGRAPGGSGGARRPATTTVAATGTSRLSGAGRRRQASVDSLVTGDALAPCAALATRTPAQN